MSFFSDPGSNPRYVLHLTVLSPSSPLVSKISAVLICLLWSWRFWRVLASYGFAWCFLLTAYRLCISGKEIMYVMSPSQCTVSWGTWFWYVSSVVRLTYITWLRMSLPGFSTVKYYFSLSIIIFLSLILASFGDTCQSQLFMVFPNGDIQFLFITSTFVNWNSTVRKSFPFASIQI